MHGVEAFFSVIAPESLDEATAPDRPLPTGTIILPPGASCCKKAQPGIPGVAAATMMPSKAPLGHPACAVGVHQPQVPTDAKGAGLPRAFSRQSRNALDE